jgi:hypothetical protein
VGGDSGVILGVLANAAGSIAANKAQAGFNQCVHQCGVGPDGEPAEIGEVYLTNFFIGNLWQQGGGGQQQRGETDCSRFVDAIVNSVEVDIDYSAPASLIFSTASVVGHSLLQTARDHSRRLGNPDHTFTGFRPELIDGGQNDGVYQHVLAHAGATVIGHNRLLQSVQDGRTGGRKATTGYQLTDFALQEDERQRDSATNPMRRRENIAEIADDHAGRLIGGDINKLINGDINRNQLRDLIFNRLCQ